jgi:hypothetical protein
MIRPEPDLFRFRQSILTNACKIKQFKIKSTGMNYPAASSGVSIQDTINLNVASDGVLNPSFAIKRYYRQMRVL